MNPDDQGPMENLLEGLDIQTRYLSADDIKAELQARGINTDEFLRKAKSAIAEADKAARLAWMKVADDKKRQLEVNRQSFVSWIERPKDEIKAAFEAFIANMEPKCSLAFRNKGLLTVEDMARILDDNERLKKHSSNGGNGIK